MNKKTKRKNVRMNKKKADKKNSNLHLEYDNFSTDDNKSYVEKNTTNEINKNVSKIKVTFMIIIITIIAVYAIYLVIKLVKNPTNTFIVTNGKISQEESEIGYIVREETVVKGKNYKNGMVKIKNEGEKVAKGDSIFRYYSSGEENLKSKIADLDVEIQQIMQNEQGAFSSDIKLLESQIEKELNSVYEVNNIQKIQEYKRNINTYITKKAKISGDLSPSGSYLKQLLSQREELENNIRKYSVYARVSPEHKVRIVKAWQKNGEVVAMTGDGVNDSPALKTSDIGCAMGIVGTDVAKEAADVILTDDNFATVVSAVEEGRRIYDNILKAIQFLLSSNVGEIIVLFVAILITPLLSKIFGIDIHLIEPLLPIHILWINLVTDSLPALALAVDPAEKDVMERKPIKPKKGIFTNGMSWRIIYQGVMIGLLTLAAFIIGLGTKDVPIIEGLTEQEVRVEIGQTMAFIVLALSELTHVFNIRNNKKSIFKTNIFNNSKLILAILTSSALMFVILLIPSLRSIFSIPVLPIGNIVEIVILVLMPIVIVEIFKLFKINTIGEK